MIEANAAFRRAFGYLEDDLRGRSLEVFVVPEERGQVADEQRSLAGSAVARVGAGSY